MGNRKAFDGLGFALDAKPTYTVPGDTLHSQKILFNKDIFPFSVLTKNKRDSKFKNIAPVAQVDRATDS